jgi:hypothetical protein
MQKEEKMCRGFDYAGSTIRFVRKSFTSTPSLRFYSRRITVGLVVLAFFIMTHPASSQIAIEPPYDTIYTFLDLGPVPGLPTFYGGLTFLLDDPDTLIIGGDANTSNGALYAIEVIRDTADHIVGFSGSASFFADAAYNDGGVAYGPDDVLFLSRWPSNEMGQTMWGSTTTDTIIDLYDFSVAYSHAALNFVPAGFPGEGDLKLVSWPNGQWYTAYISPDGSGTYDIDSVNYETTISGGPEGFIYIPPGSPLFSDYNSMLVSEWSADEVAAYELDATGNPDPPTRVSFITGLYGAEGAAIDPLTGDFLFSTFGGGDRVIVVQGFATPGVSETITREIGDLFALKQIGPNPFSQHTSLTFCLRRSGYVTLKVFDILGQVITTLVAHQLSAGTHTITWNASGVSSGVYFCRLGYSGFVAEKKLLLLR